MSVINFHTLHNTNTQYKYHKPKTTNAPIEIDLIGHLWIPPAQCGRQNEVQQRHDVVGSTIKTLGVEIALAFGA